MGQPKEKRENRWIIRSKNRGQGGPTFGKREKQNGLIVLKTQGGDGPT